MLLTVTSLISLPTLQQTSFAKDLLCVSVIISNTLLYDIILLINCYSILAKLWLLLKSFRSNFGSFQRGGCDVYVHVTRGSQLELKRARCKISNEGYVSHNIWVIFYYSTGFPVGGAFRQKRMQK